MLGYQLVLTVSTLTFAVTICKGGRLLSRNFTLTSSTGFPISDERFQMVAASTDEEEDVDVMEVDQGRRFGSNWFWSGMDAVSSGKSTLTTILEQVKVKILDGIKSNAAVAVNARGDAYGGGHGGHGHGFPTLEIALLTLAFLTFAVFVVNLVQQLLARLTMTTTPLMGRRRRSVVPLPQNMRDVELQEFSALASIVLDSIEKPMISKWFQ